MEDDLICAGGVGGQFVRAEERDGESVVFDNIADFRRVGADADIGVGSAGLACLVDGVADEGFAEEGFYVFAGMPLLPPGQG